MDAQRRGRREWFADYTVRGLTLPANLRTDSGYCAYVLPVFVLIGLGTGWVLITVHSVATLEAGADTSIAGAIVMTSQKSVRR